MEQEDDEEDKLPDRDLVTMPDGEPIDEREGFLTDAVSDGVTELQRDAESAALALREDNTETL